MPGAGPRAIYRTATTLDGFIADSEDSLSWLFAVEDDPAEGEEYARFLERVSVYVEGSTTYEWVLREANLLAEPQKWQGYYGDRPTFVFTTRELPRPDGADVRFLSGPVSDALPEIRAAATGGDIWITGGGDLAGQFFEAGALDRVELSVAPVTLGSGAPLLPRRIDSTRLRLDTVAAHGQFIAAAYEVLPAAS